MKILNYPLTGLKKKKIYVHAFIVGYLAKGASLNGHLLYI